MAFEFDVYLSGKGLIILFGYHAVVFPEPYVVIIVLVFYFVLTTQTFIMGQSF